MRDWGKVREQVQQCPDEHLATYRDEILEAFTLAAKVEELEAQLRTVTLERDCLIAQRHMTIARLGGIVEGHPTSEINFLQRVDELRGIEARFVTARNSLQACIDYRSDIPARNYFEADQRDRNQKERT